MAAEHATGGYVVTSGRLTQDARSRFAKLRDIELIDDETLSGLLREPKNSVAAATIAPADAIRVSPRASPRCNEPMISRIAKRGANSGDVAEASAW